MHISNDNYVFLEKCQLFDQLSQFDQLNRHHKEADLVGLTVKVGQIVGQVVRNSWSSGPTPPQIAQ